MARILKIDTTSGACTIGMDNGGVRIVHVNEIDYDYPMVGDFVDVVEKEHDVLITKRSSPSTASTSQAWGTAGTSQNSYEEWPQASNMPYGQQAYGQEPYRKGKAVSKLGYVLFAIMLGTFGAHKFYAGKTGQGIIYIVFFWTGIPTIVGLVEGIIALTKPADANGNIYFD